MVRHGTLKVMEAASGSSPTNKLAELRAQRRWRQRDLADQVEVMSRRVLGHTLSVSERTISRWEHGDIPSAPAQRVLAAVFAVEVDGLGFVVPVHSQAASNARVDTPTPDDAVELVARLTSSDTSAGTTHMLARRVDRLCRDYPVRPAADLLAETRRWLKHTVDLADQRSSLHQHRELLVNAGWLAALTACLTYDLGDAAAADMWREATYQLAEEVGHAELTGWSYEIAAWMALTQSRPADAVEYAQAGLRIDGTSCVAVQLAAQEARAWAQLGDRQATEAAIARGNRVLDALPAPVHPDHHFVIDPAKADFYAMDCYRWLGMSDVATEHAHRVLDYCERPDGTIRSPMRRSEALLTFGVVSARQGDLATAVGYGLAGLGDRRKNLPSLLSAAAELDRELARHQRDRTVREWREALHALRVPLAITDGQG